MPQLTAITRFPVKGLGPDRMDAVALQAGKVLPGDRRWAIENGPGPFDPDNPGHVKKKHFLMLAGQAQLARLDCRYEDAGHRLSVAVDAGETVTVELEDTATHASLFDRLAALLGDQLRGPMRIVSAPGQAMTDIPQPHISLINAASVRDLAARTGHELDPVRFRGNLLIDGLEPWAEFDWIGRDVRIGDAVLRAQDPIGRCAATSVNLDTGERDIDLPKALFEHYGHTRCGLYLSVAQGGRIAVGDPVLLDGTGATA